MKTFGVIAIVLLLAILMGAASTARPTEQPAGRRAGPQPAAQPSEDDRYSEAICVCQEWAQSQAQGAVRFLHEFRLADASPANMASVVQASLGERNDAVAPEARRYRVGLEYKVKGTPMRARCEVTFGGNRYHLLAAKAEAVSPSLK